MTLAMACWKDAQTSQGAVEGPGCPGHDGYCLLKGRRVRKTKRKKDLGKYNHKGRAEKGFLKSWAGAEVKWAWEKCRRGKSWNC